MEQAQAQVIAQVQAIFINRFPDWELSKYFLQTSLLHFLSSLSEVDVIDAMKIACERMGNEEEAVRYFCGICWTKLREKPIRRKLRKR